MRIFAVINISSGSTFFFRMRTSWGKDINSRSPKLLYKASCFHHICSRTENQGHRGLQLLPNDSQYPEPTVPRNRLDRKAKQ